MFLYKINLSGKAEIQIDCSTEGFYNGIDIKKENLFL